MQPVAARIPVDKWEMIRRLRHRKHPATQGADADAFQVFRTFFDFVLIAESVARADGAFEFAGGFPDLLAGNAAVFELEELGALGGGFFEFPVLRMVRANRLPEAGVVLFADKKFVIDDDFAAVAGHLPFYHDLGLPAHAQMKCFF